MEALVCRKLGDPTIPPNSPDDSSPFTHLTSHPIPHLDSPTSVRVRVKATSLNYLNYLQVQGLYQEKPSLPFIPGSDFSGIVDSVGPHVTNFKIGDRVSSNSATGSYAQFVVVDERLLVHVPDECNLVAAGALLVAYGTSHATLIHRAQLRSGQVLLVLGAAGGVGVAAVQIGKICGAIVIAVARGAQKVQLLKSMNVDHVVDSSKESVSESVKAFLKTRKLKGADVLYDPVGGKPTKEALKLLNQGAQILIVGFASGEVPVIPANIALVKNWTVHGFYWGGYSVLEPTLQNDTLRELLSLLGRGLISVPISHTCSLSEAHVAFSAIKDRKAIGKVMITFDDDKTARSKL